MKNQLSFQTYILTYRLIANTGIGIGKRVSERNTHVIAGVRRNRAGCLMGRRWGTKIFSILHSLQIEKKIQFSFRNFPFTLLAVYIWIWFFFHIHIIIIINIIAEQHSIHAGSELWYQPAGRWIYGGKHFKFFELQEKGTDESKTKEMNGNVWGGKKLVLVFGKCTWLASFVSWLAWLAVSEFVRRWWLLWWGGI